MIVESFLSYSSRRTVERPSPHPGSAGLRLVKRLARDGAGPCLAPMSRAQLNAFVLKINADPELKARVDAAVDASEVVAIAAQEGHPFSAASWTRHLRG